MGVCLDSSLVSEVDATLGLPRGFLLIHCCCFSAACFCGDCAARKCLMHSEVPCSLSNWLKGESDSTRGDRSRADRLAYASTKLVEPCSLLACIVIRALDLRKHHARFPRTRYPGSAPSGVVCGSRVAPTNPTRPGHGDQKAAMLQSVLLEARLEQPCRHFVFASDWFSLTTFVLSN